MLVGDLLVNSIVELLDVLFLFNQLLMLLECADLVVNDLLLVFLFSDLFISVVDNDISNNFLLLQVLFISRMLMNCLSDVLQLSSGCRFISNQSFSLVVQIVDLVPVISDLFGKCFDFLEKFS